MNKTCKIPIWNERYTSWNELPVLLSIDETALLMRIGRDSVSKMCQEGTIPAMRFGKQWRIDKIKLQEMFNINL